MHPSASFSAAIRVRIDNRPGAFARLAAAIGEAGGLLGAIDLVRVEQDTKIRDVTVLADDEGHLERIVHAVRAIDGIEAGVFPPQPEEPFLCNWCAYASVCRKDYVGDE